MVFLQTSACFCSTHSTNQCFLPPIINPTPLLVKKGLHIELDLVSMLVMLSPTSFLMMTPRKSYTDLLLDLQILPIPTRDWYQMEGRAPRPPNPIIFVGSRQDDSQSATKPMSEYNPDDPIGRTFLLPKNEQG